MFHNLKAFKAAREQIDEIARFLSGAARRGGEPAGRRGGSQRGDARAADPRAQIAAMEVR